MQIFVRLAEIKSGNDHLAHELEFSVVSNPPASRTARTMVTILPPDKWDLIIDFVASVVVSRPSGSNYASLRAAALTCHVKRGSRALDSDSTNTSSSTHL